MASYKVIIPFTFKGKAYAKDDTITLSAERAATYERIDYIKAESAKKAPVKSVKAAKKAGKNTITLEPTTDATE